MKKVTFRSLFALVIATVSLAGATLSATPASASNNYNNTPWYQQWEGCEYKMQMGKQYCNLIIDRCALPNSHDKSYCYFEGTVKIGHETFTCHGYAKPGSFCYFTIDGGANMCCIGGFSSNMSQMGGNFCDLDHCNAGNYGCQFVTDHRK